MAIAEMVGEKHCNPMVVSVSLQLDIFLIFYVSFYNQTPSFVFLFIFYYKVIYLWSKTTKKHLLKIVTTNTTTA